MGGPCVIEVFGRSAGLVVPQEDGSFRFFASVRQAFALERQVFRSVADACVAVKATMNPGHRGREAVRKKGHDVFA